MCKEKNFEETPEFAKIYPEMAEFSYFRLYVYYIRKVENHKDPNWV